MNSKRFFLGVAALSVLVKFDGQAQNMASLEKLQPVPFTAVKITDSFWSARQETNRIASIPVSLDNLEKEVALATTNDVIRASQTRPYYTTGRIVYLVMHQDVSKFRYHNPQNTCQNEWGYFFPKGTKLCNRRPVVSFGPPDYYTVAIYPK